MSTPYIPIQDLVDVVVSVSPQVPVNPTFNQGLILGSSGVIPTTGANSRIRQYSTLAQMVSDGFTTSSAEYLQASFYFAQQPPAQFVWIGAQSPSGLYAANAHTGAAGTNYKVGDLIFPTQGSATGGVFQVGSVTSGAVTSLLLITSGQGYTVPASAVATTTSGSGTGLTIDLTTGAASVIPHAANPGSNYLIGDIVSVTGTDVAGVSLQVTSTIAGVVTGLKILARGTISLGYTATGLTATGGSGTGLEVDITALEGEPPLQAVIACRAAQSAWYAFCCATTVDADDLALALWAQTSVPAAVYFYRTPDANVLNNVTNNIAATMQAANYSFVVGFYSTIQNGAAPNSVFMASAAMGVAMGLNTGLAGSFYALFAKQLVGMLAEPLTQTQITSLQSLNINVYVNYGNAFTFITQGLMPNGWRFWRRINLDMIVSNIQFGVMDVWTSTLVVPQTDQGEMLFIQAVNTAAATSAGIGYVAPGTWSGVQLLSLVAGTALPNGYLAQFPSYLTQTNADRLAGKAMPIYLAIIEAGSAESITIQVNVQA
jgi:hypothetical protein